MAEAIDHIDALKQTKDGHLTSDEILRMKAIIQSLDAKGVFDAKDTKASIEKIESEFLKIQGATRNKLEELKFFINSDVKIANKLILTPQETAVIQKEYGVEPIDGVPGFHTWVAIIRIQKKYGKVMDGVMGKETQDALVRDATKNSVVRIKGTSEVKDAMPYKQDATKGLFNVLADQFQKLPFPNTELLKSFPNDLFSKIDAILQNKNIPENVMLRFVRDLQRYHADIRSINPEEIDKHVKITNVPDWKPVDSVHTLIYTRLTQPILLMIQDMQMAYIDPHIKLGNDSISYHKGKYEELTGGLQGLDKKYGISVTKGMETMFSNEKRDIRGIDWDGSIGRSICSQLESQGYTFGDSNYVKSISGAPLNRGNMREKDTKIFKNGNLLLDSANRPVDIIEVILAYRGAMNQWRGSEGEIRAFRAQSKDTPSVLGKILSPDAKELVMDHQFNTLPPKLVLQQMTAIEKELLFDGLKELAPFFGDFMQMSRFASEIRHSMDAKGEVVYWNGKISRVAQMALALFSIFLGYKSISKFLDFIKNEENFNRVKKGFDFLRVNTLTKDFSGEKRANNLMNSYFKERKVDMGIPEIEKLLGDGLDKLYVQGFSMYLKQNPAIMEKMASFSSDQYRMQYIQGIYENWVTPHQITNFIKESIQNSELSGDALQQAFRTHLIKDTNIIQRWKSYQAPKDKQEAIVKAFRDWQKGVEEIHGGLKAADNTIPLDFSNFREIYGQEIRAMMESDEGRKLYHVLEKADPMKNRKVYDSVYLEFLNYLRTNPSIQQKIIEAQGTRDDKKQFLLRSIFEKWSMRKTNIDGKEVVASDALFTEWLSGKKNPLFKFWSDNHHPSLDTSKRIEVEAFIRSRSGKARRANITDNFNSLSPQDQSLVRSYVLGNNSGKDKIMQTVSQFAQDFPKKDKVAQESFQSIEHSLASIRGNGIDGYAKFRETDMYEILTAHMKIVDEEKIKLMNSGMTGSQLEKEIMKFRKYRLQEVAMELRNRVARAETFTPAELQKMQLPEKLAHLRGGSASAIITLPNGRSVSTTLSATEGKYDILMLRCIHKKDTQSKFDAFPDFGGAIPIRINRETGEVSHYELITHGPYAHNRTSYEEDIRLFVEQSGLTYISKKADITQDSLKIVAEYGAEKENKLLEIGTRVMDNGNIGHVYLLQAEEKGAKYQMEITVYRNSNGEGTVYIGSLIGGEAGRKNTRLTPVIIGNLARNTLPTDLSFSSLGRIFQTIRDFHGIKPDHVEYFRVRDDGGTVAFADSTKSMIKRYTTTNK